MCGLHHGHLPARPDRGEPRGASDISFHSRASDDGGGGAGGDSASESGSAITLDTTFSAETLASKEAVDEA